MTKAYDVALVLVEGQRRRAVVATVTAEATVGELAAQLGYDAPLYRAERALPSEASLVDAGLLSGDEIGVGAAVSVDWRQLGAELRVIGGDGAGLRRRVDGRGLVIGRSDEADVALRSARVSRTHAEITLGDNGFRVRDLRSRNGVEVEGVAVAGGGFLDVPFGAVVRIGDSLITVSPAGETATTLRRSDPFHLAFSGGRGMRVADRPGHVAPAAEPRSVARRSIVPFVVPSAGAAALAATASGAPRRLRLRPPPSRSPPRWASSGWCTGASGAGRRARPAGSTTRQVACYEDALGSYARAARAAMPDPASLLALTEHRGPRLWSSTAADLVVRIGLYDDDGVWMPQTVALGAAPVVIAGSEPNLDALFVWMVVQAAALVPARELDVVVISEYMENWAWTAWLPHRAHATVLPADSTPGDLPPRRASRRLIVLDRPHSPRWTGDPTLSGDDIVLWRSAHEEDVPYNASAVLSAASAAFVRLEDALGVRDDVLVDAVARPTEFASRVALALARLQSPFGAAAVAGPIGLTEVVPALGSVDGVLGAWRQARGPLRRGDRRG